VSALARLASGEVHVYCASLAPAGEGAVAAWLGALDARERSRHARLVFERDRRAFAAAHALLRCALSRYAAVDPAAWTFVADPGGKPRLAGPVGAPPLTFNLSHASGVAACAVALDREVGVDVESLDRALDDLAVADACLAPAELADVCSCPGPDRLGRLLEYWTLKEAYLKARGVGLAVPPRAVELRLEPGGGVAALLDATGGGAARWCFAQLRTASHVVAVAVDRAGRSAPRVRVLDGRPLLAARPS
jgi:4'-phosphopantetheinyl transferase